MAPRTPLVDPREYFQSQCDPFVGGATVFASYYVAVWLWLVVLATTLFTLEQALSMLLEVMTVGAINAVVGWLLIGAIMHVGSRGTGSFSDALAVAGWTFAPQLLVFVPMVAYGWLALSRRSIVGSDREQLFVEFAAGAPFPELPMLTLAITIPWSIYILTYGVAETHRVQPKVSVLPAFLVGILMFLGALFGS